MAVVLPVCSVSAMCSVAYVSAVYAVYFECVCCVSMSLSAMSVVYVLCHPRLQCQLCLLSCLLRQLFLIAPTVLCFSAVWGHCSLVVTGKWSQLQSEEAPAVAK